MPSLFCIKFLYLCVVYTQVELTVYVIICKLFFQSSFDFPESGEARATFTNVVPQSVMTVEVLNGSRNLTVAYEQVNNTD